MSIISNFRKFFGSTSDNVSTSPVGSKAAITDLRAHARLSPGVDNIVWVSSNSLKNPKLLDLSYGGAAIEASLIDDMVKEMEIEINSVDRRITLKAKLVHRRASQAGLSFIHDSSDGLIFLRESIENMKCGASLLPLPQEHMKEDYRSVGARLWRGDGPSDLQLFPQGFNGKSNQTTMQLTFRDGKEYHQVAIGDGRIITSKSRDFQDPEIHRGTDFMTTSRTVDLDSLRKALLLICGITEQDLIKQLGGTIAEALTCFQSNLRLVR